MKKIKITTPENIEVEYNLADIGSRAAASLIDMIIQAIVIILLVVAIWLIAYFSKNFWMKYYGWIIGISLVLLAIINFGYFIAMELSMNGQTIGKKVLKLRAIRNNGQPITLKHSAIRNLFRVFIDMFGVGMVFIFFTKEHKRLGDFIASTIVVVEKSKSIPITLESLKKVNEHFSYYISKDEQELLRDYLERKDKMENCSELREELKNHFIKKFEALGTLKEWESFINKL